MFRNIIGYGMVAPTIMVHGTPEQQQRFLRPLFTGEEIWCQLFSEPGAGSDVAGLAMTAERDGDEWRLNGQKVWTTLAHVSAFGLIIARTNPDVPKHKGITAFLVDMHAPGVDVRPLYQATGEAEFNECFFTDVRVPDTHAPGRRRRGLGRVDHDAHERARLDRRHRAPARLRADRRGPRDLATALGRARRRARDGRARRAARRLGAQRGGAPHQLARERPAPGRHARARRARSAKLAFAEENQRTSELCVDLLGADGMLYSTNYPLIRPSESALAGDDMRKAFIRMRANSIEGGTSEVMRNIIGERVLGLPGEPRADKDVAWRDVPRS